MFRGFSSGQENEKASAAVLGVISSLMVPIVIFSVRMLGENEQLHPQVAANQGFSDVRYLQTLFVSSLSLISLSFWLFIVRLNQLLIWEYVEDRTLVS